MRTRKFPSMNIVISFIIFVFIFLLFISFRLTPSGNMGALPYIIDNHQYSDYTDGTNVSIFYPKLSAENNADNLNIEEINQLLCDSAKKVLNEERAYGSSISGSYYITLASSELLSVVYIQSVYAQGAAFPVNECSAVTIDLKQGHVLCLSDFAVSSESIQSKIMNNEYEVNYGCLKTFSHTDVWNSIETSYDIDPLEDHINDFFVSYNKRFYLIVNGFSHGSGDYSILSF